jgi:selenocysteine lyase/cysteine desulfurase
MDLSSEALDREFPSRRTSIQFNHAAVAPLPARAAAALSSFASRLAGNGGLDFREWEETVGRLRSLAAGLVGAREASGGAASVSIVPNTTAGLSLVASGLDWREGDEVVTTATEFPANIAPWLGLARRGVLARRIPTVDGAFTPADVERAMTPRTRLVSVSLVSFHTGFLADAAAIGALCRSRGVLFGLDAIQAAGAVEVDVEAWGVDFLSADGHKWMLGTEGCGILFTSPSLRPRLTPPAGWTNLVRPFGTFGPEEGLSFREDGRRFEPGALPMPGVTALAGSLSLLSEIGARAVKERIGETLSVLVEGLPRLGWEPVLFGGPPLSGILAARPPLGCDPRRVAAEFEKRRIFVSAREGLLRLSPHVGNDEEEASRLLEGLRIVSA